MDARQQLELAGAEIQVAMDQTETIPESENPEIDALLGMADGVAPAIETDNDVPEVRSEIAELFGINSSDGSDAVPQDETSLTAVDDYSQESSAAVSMSFSEAQSVLMDSPAEVAEEADAAESDDEDGDDFVARYMENLLARNRENAGTSLPEELSNPLVAESESKPEPPQPAQPRSFLDAYMSGEYNPDNDPVPSAADIPPETVREPETKRPERQKIDLNELRDNMDSFRQVSTRSVENALATHAQKQERGGLTARKLILISLILATMGAAAGAIVNLIPFLVVYVVGGLAGLSAVELMMKSFSVNRRVRNVAETAAGPDGVRPDRNPAQITAGAEPTPVEPSAAPSSNDATDTFADEADSLSAPEADAPLEEQLSQPEVDHVSDPDTDLEQPESDTLSDQLTFEATEQNDIPN